MKAFSSKAKIVFYKVLVAGPALALAYVGIHARTFHDPYNPLGYDADQQSHLDAYREPTVAVQDAFAKGAGEVPIEKLVSLSDLYLDGAKSHKLQPIYAINTEDSSDEGVRSEIFKAALDLDVAMVRNADRLSAAGQKAKAADLLVRELKFAEILKYSDFNVLPLFRTHQSHALAQLASLQADLPNQRAQIISELKGLTDGQRALDRLTFVDRNVFAESQRRVGLEPVSIVEPVSTASEPKQPDKAHSRRTVGLMLADGSNHMPAIVTDQKAGYAEEQKFEVQLAKTIAEWSQSATASTGK